MFDNTMVVLLIDRGKGKTLGNAREYRKGNPWLTETRETGNKTKKNKAKTQHNMRWTPLYVSKYN
jgi:hypothetical protein